MIAYHNGNPMLNGIGVEDRKLVQVSFQPIEDLLEPETRPVSEFAQDYPLKAAALRYYAGMDSRTLQEIADELGCSKQALGRHVCTIADRLNLETVAPGRRQKKSAAHLAARGESIPAQNSNPVNAEVSND